MFIESKITHIYFKEEEIEALKKAKDILSELSHYYENQGITGYVANNYALVVNVISSLINSNYIKILEKIPEDTWEKMYNNLFPEDNLEEK